MEYFIFILQLFAFGTVCFYAYKLNETNKDHKKYITECKKKIDELNNILKTNDEKTKLEKVDLLRLLVCSHYYAERGIPGSEQELKPILDESQKESVVNKMFDIIYKL